MSHFKWTSLLPRPVALNFAILPINRVKKVFSSVDTISPKPRRLVHIADPTGLVRHLEEASRDRTISSAFVDTSYYFIGR